MRAFYDVIEDGSLLNDRDRAGNNPVNLSVEERANAHYQEKEILVLKEQEFGKEEPHTLPISNDIDLSNQEY